MKRKYYFMAGLPRSGSTVLTAILNQNPKFYSGPSSPVLPSMYALNHSLVNDQLFSAYPKEKEAKLMISSLIDSYYSDRKETIIFDKNRAWPSKINYIQTYITDNVKIICPVRDPDEILASFISMIKRNPYQEGQSKINFVDEKLVKNNLPINDINRCDYLASANGILGESSQAISQAIREGHGDKIHFVEYHNLVDDPLNTMKEIYEFIGEKYYEHTFDNLENKNREKDLEVYGLSDMHEIRPVLEDTSEDPKKILPEEIVEKCKGSDFWRRLSLIN
jgi:sulfotransferase